MHGTDPIKKPLIAPWAMWIFIIGVSSMVAVSAINTIRRESASNEPQAPARGLPASDSQREPGPLRIVATLPPLLWVAKQLAPPDAQFTLLVPPGQGCHGIELVPSQIAATRRADLVLMVGAGLEPQLEDMTTPHEQRRIVLAASLPPGEPLLEETHNHNHNHNHNHTHDHAHDHPADPHAWLDPQVMLRFIDQAAAQLSEQSPADAPATQERAERAKLTVRRIDQLYRERLTALPTKTIVTHHNAWAYLARRYGLEVAAVIQPMHDVEPTPGDVAAAADAIRARGVHAIFVEPQFSRAAADRIAAATGARVLTLDSLGDGDWPEMMERNLDALIQGLATK